MDSNKKMVNYFKRWDGANSLGMGMMIAGFLMIWLGFAYSYILYMIGIPFLAGGFAIFLYGNVGRANENDLLEKIKSKRENVNFEELKEDAQYRRRIPRILTEEVCEGYTFRRDDSLMIKMLRTRAIISSEYLFAKIAILTDAFYIKVKSFSFITDEKSDITYEIFFDQVENIEIVRDVMQLPSVNKKMLNVKTCDLVITYDGGKQLILHRKDDFYADGLATTLKQAIEDAKKR